jgi:hypothetical protein
LAVIEADLLKHFPRLWHMAERGSWPSIRRHGLLSAASLLNLYEVPDPTRAAILSARRPDSVVIRADGLADAVIRDQKPMTDSALLRCLKDGLEPRDWYEILNRRTFFWLSRDRLKRLLQARAYRHKRQTVLTLDTQTILEVHRNRIELSPINSGSTIFNPQPRGRDTFTRIDEYPFDYWKAARGGARNAIVELIVVGGVPDVNDHVLTVHDVMGAESELVWRRPGAALLDDL